MFCSNSVAVARYDALIRAKSPTNCDIHLAESIFQTRSRGRVISYMTSLSLFPSSRKRICCSVPIKIRSFILSLSNARTKRMWS
ncbi:DUF6783 domain-containing protein [Blautia wexlerae]|uniref:DUF6783 domain-containing protein n=1 Tax=Blautia wexlerae TaxID=418240 RepID=UPI00299F83EB|nr:DUF6783 domain-containing protein [Blautia wexlerae]